MKTQTIRYNMKPNTAFLFAVSLFALLSAGTSIHAATLVAHYSLDGTNNDASGNNLHLSTVGTPALGFVSTGTPLNALYTQSGDFGPSDTTSRYRQVADNALLDITGSLSLSAWIYSDGLNDFSQGIVGKWVGSNDDRSYVLALTSDGRLNFALSDNGTSTGSAFSNLFTPVSSPIATGVWTHVAAVYDDGGAGPASMRIYVNGSEQAALTSGVVESIFNSAAPLTLGAQFQLHSAPYNFDGKMNDVRVYSGALTASEVATLAVIPEPSTGIFLTLGVAALAAARRRRSSANFIQ